MELKVFQDTLTAAGAGCEVKAELPVETEILIPDYLPQVFKIVKCFVYLVGLQKQVTGSRLVLDGYLRCVVFYQAEGDQSLCQTEQKLPFTKTVELPEGEYPASHVHLTGEIEYLNCRAVNQRRVDVRGAYGVTASVSARSEQQLITALTGGGAEQKTCLLQGVQSVADLDKLITAEEEVNFPQQPAAVLDISGTGTVQELKIISGKAVVRGYIQARILYRTGPGYHTELHRQNVPFHQIVDVDGLTEDCSCFAGVEPVGCTMMAGSGPEGSSMVTVTALLHLRAFRQTECCAVEDAFSTQYAAEVTYCPLVTERLAATVDGSADCRIQGALPDEHAEIIQCFVTPSPVELAPGEDGALVLRGRAVAHVLCMNSLGEIECYDKGFEYLLPGSYPGTAGQYRVECWPAAQEITAQKTGADLTASVKMGVTGVVLCRHTAQVVESIRCETPLEPQDPGVALRICYASAGENVFDIAKRYHVSPKGMLQSNHLEQLQLDEDARLLVPMSV